MSLFGKCKEGCGREATGSYYWWTDGYCSECRNAINATLLKEEKDIEEEAINAIATHLSCSIKAATYILNRINKK